MGVFDIVLGTHVAAGGTALAVFWLPMVLAKGGRAHRRIGWVFVAAMAVVSLSGLALAGHRFFGAGRPGVKIGAAFLGYIAVLTGAGAYKGVRVLRAKTRTGPSRNLLDLGFGGLVLLGGVGVGSLGLVYRAPLLVIFGVVGALGGWGNLAYWLRPPQERMHWWLEHMGDMVGTSVAALTAFTVQNAPRLGLARFSLVVWLAPALIGLPLLAVWQWRYRRRFAATAPAPVPSPTSVSLTGASSEGWKSP